MACQHVLTLPVADLPTTIQFISDSQLAVKQLGFEWAVKDENLLSIFRETRDLLSMIEAHCSVTLTHVKREENKLADLICNQVQDAHGVVSSKKGIKKS
jgi:ribonuclease HI